jgi:hypothetical protein
VFYRKIRIKYNLLLFSQDINSNLDEGQEKLNKACELAQKLLRNATPESRKVLQAQVDKLKEAWDNLQGRFFFGVEKIMRPVYLKKSVF